MLTIFKIALTFFEKRPEVFIFAAMKNQKEKRVLVGMSGGIDSSATCIMLQASSWGPTLMTSSKLNHLPKARHPNTIIL